MLFNTLAYAKFFAVVFAAFWLLSERRLALWLPWVFLAAAVAFRGGAAPYQGLIELGVVVIAGMLTWTWSRQARAHREGGPSLVGALASSAINLAGLAWVLPGDGNLVLAGLEALRVIEPPIETFGLGWAGRLGLTIAAYGVAVVGLTAFLLARRVRLLFLVGASYVFYAHWNWRFLPLIFASSSIDYWLGARIGQTDDPRARKRWLFATVALNLGVLGTFKYLDFGVRAATDALSALGFHPEPLHLQIALPVAISFFTFESMSYVIDVYRRRIPPHRSYLEYLGFVAFFPHLVAGPIVRPAVLLPQLGAPKFDAKDGSAALYLIAVGLLKKVVIGDTLALNLVDRVFDAPAQFSSLECYAAVVGYALQIYCDFSGYSDVAIGSALLLGVRLPLNFDAPYTANNIRDFWRRWHISLSSWLRDYLYIPLGGNRRGRPRALANLMITMLLGGLWHGASYNYVIWGALHGAALVVYQLWTSGREQTTPSLVRKCIGVFFTFQFVCAAWVFFRAETLTKAWAMFAQMARLSTFHPNLPTKVVAVLLLGLVSHFIPDRWFVGLKDGFIRAPAWAQGLSLVGVAVILDRMISQEVVPFVYFQF